MLGFLSKEKDLSAKIKRKQIYFVSCPNHTSVSDAKQRFAKIAKQFANKLKINNVYLHIGKVIIVYEFKV